MRCPDCQNDLHLTQLKGIAIHECLKCKGKWFERNELVRAKNKADDALRWLHFDPFGKDAQQLSVAGDGKECPQCLKQMQSLTFLQSKVVIDKCQTCEGVWLSHGELAKIILYLEKVVDSKPAKDLAKDTFKEFIEIFKGRQEVISESKDFMAVLNILETRIAAEHPALATTWLNIEQILPFK